MSSVSHYSHQTKKRTTKSKARRRGKPARASRKVCEERLACKGDRPEATFHCADCQTNQCYLCEDLLHVDERFSFHRRQELERPPDSFLCHNKCETRNFADVFCRTCEKNFCFDCDYTVHSRPEKVRHLTEPFGLTSPETESEDEFISCPYVDNEARQTELKDQDQSEEHLNFALCNTANNSIGTMEGRQLPDVAAVRNQHDQLESSKKFETITLNDGAAIMKLGSDESEEEPRTKSFLLVDDLENMQVSSSAEFCQKLLCSPTSSVKVVSIFGNTGEGKSHTMNYTFFGGKKVFQTSPAQDSCTIGIWAAYDPERRIITMDTEGLLGVTENNNRRTRLLLKVLAVSDVIIYRTRAERLHNDLFTFLGDASKAYLQHFSTELKEASKRLKLTCTLSDMGPVVIIFHETLHTETLSSDKGETPEDVIRTRFQQMELSTEAFSAIQYVGIRTANPPTCFTSLQAAVERHVQNSTVRSARLPEVIFDALKHLNEKFSGDIEKRIPSMFPDQYFTCCSQCLSCGARCSHSMNHDRSGIPHSSSSNCRYQHQYDNRVYHCRACYDRGEEIMVIPKATASTESNWFGLARYALSGYILECSNCGVIYRSRQYWYGNRDPCELAARTQIQHIWPGETSVNQGAQNAAQRVVDGVAYVSETVTSISAKPSKFVSSWVADQIAPSYWIPNARIMHCGNCQIEFGELDKKHHCRACGGGFCENCSSKKRSVPERGWGDTPVRVCDQCYNKDTASDNDKGEPPEVTARFVGEVLHNTLGTVVSAMDYPLEWIKDSARPEYWIPDKDIKNCKICNSEFSEKNLIHHCRSCGHGVCDNCSLNRKPVPCRGWDHTVRVCDQCSKKL